MSLKERLARYLRNNHGWIASGDLQRIVAEKTAYSPQNVGRRLRELENDGVLEVQLRRGHAYYRIAENVPTLF
jgi:DNA-binding Lrp family transcriptional regulator